MNRNMPKQNKAPDDKDGRKSLLQYAGMSAQFLVLLGVGVFLGIKIDGWLKLSTPIATWLLPLLLLVGVLVKMVRDTGK
jgi:hypothetical protein